MQIPSSPVGEDLGGDLGAGEGGDFGSKSIAGVIQRAAGVIEKAAAIKKAAAEGCWEGGELLG